MTDVSLDTTSPPAGADAILDARGLVKEFPIKGGLFGRTVAKVEAVSGVDLAVRRQETLGLVGESGCGKSTVGRLLVKLLTPTAGSVVYAGNDIASLREGELRPLRRKLQMVFQDPYASLQPRMTIGAAIAEPLIVHENASRVDAERRVRDLLRVVGLSPEHATRFPHEFSGGQRQRVGVARALALEPEVIILDEPVSALDVSIQAGIVNLLKTLQDRLGLAYVFIAHDLSVVRHIADRVAVMYLGKIVEVASRDELFDRPTHPYTEALLSAIPVPDPTRRSRRILLQGDLPSPLNPPKGCSFHTRCPIAQPGTCDVEPPVLERSGSDPDHVVSCHLRT